MSRCGVTGVLHVLYSSYGKNSSGSTIKCGNCKACCITLSRQDFELNDNVEKIGLITQRDARTCGRKHFIIEFLLYFTVCRRTAWVANRQTSWLSGGVWEICVHYIIKRSLQTQKRSLKVAFSCFLSTWNGIGNHFGKKLFLRPTEPFEKMDYEDRHFFHWNDVNWWIVHSNNKNVYYKSKLDKYWFYIDTEAAVSDFCGASATELNWKNNLQ